MKNHLLEHIFVLSRRSSAHVPSELPPGLETAVLAHWRAASREASDLGAVHALRWAAGLACAIALISASLQRDQLARLSNRFDPQTGIADSALSAGFVYE